MRVTLLALGSKHLVSWVDMACGGDTINMNIIWMDDRKVVVKMMTTDSERPLQRRGQAVAERNRKGQWPLPKVRKNMNGDVTITQILRECSATSPHSRLRNCNDWENFSVILLVRYSLRPVHVLKAYMNFNLRHVEVKTTNAAVSNNRNSVSSAKSSLHAMWASRTTIIYVQRNVEINAPHARGETTRAKDE